jgi:hypothetical protein
MTTVTHNNLIKKTFNIKADLVCVMQELIPSRKQTDFVNEAIAKSIQEKKEKIAKKKV